MKLIKFFSAFTVVHHNTALQCNKVASLQTVYFTGLLFHRVKMCYVGCSARDNITVHGVTAGY